MSNKEKFILAIAGLAIVLALSALVVNILKTSPAQIVDNVGSIGGLAIENYLPVIKHNGGYYSELPISLSGSSGTLTISATGGLTVTATSTISKSYDGMILQANFTVSTGTAKAIITNSTGVDMMCSTGNVYFDATAAFVPSLVVGVGVSSSGGYSVGLLASTTIATSTDTLTSTAAAGFYLAKGSSITGSLSDYAGMTVSSSTYYSLWDAEMAFPCWLVGQ